MANKLTVKNTSKKKLPRPIGPVDVISNTLFLEHRGVEIESHVWYREHPVPFEYSVLEIPRKESEYDIVVRNWDMDDASIRSFKKALLKCDGGKSLVSKLITDDNTSWCHLENVIDGEVIENPYGTEYACIYEQIGITYYRGGCLFFDMDDSENIYVAAHSRVSIVSEEWLYVHPVMSDTGMEVSVELDVDKSGENDTQ